MNYQEIVEVTTHVIARNPLQAIMIHGAPGCGKSHVAMHGVPEALQLPDDAVMMFRPSNHDPVDLTGLPLVTENYTRWVTPDFLQHVNAKAKKYGRCVFTLDEINQSVPMMFNTLNGLILDRRIGDFQLDPGVVLLATGNRQTDKAASNRMPSHTANRLLHLDMESNLDGWCKWAIGAGLPMWGVAFLRFKPQLLNDFDPDRRENPTERSWEMFLRAAGDDCPKHLLGKLARGFVGEGAAAEVAAFREVMDEMPNPDGVMLDPKRSRVPELASAKYALCGALAQRVTKTNLDAALAYGERLPKEFEVLLMRDAYALKPEIASTPAFLKWATSNSGVFV